MRTRAGESTGWPSRFAGWTTDMLENLNDGVYPIRNRVLGLDFLFDFPAQPPAPQPACPEQGRRVNPCEPDRSAPWLSWSRIIPADSKLP
jgi:hypothetical protein